MPDIARNPALLRRRRLRRTAYASVVGVVLVGVSIVLARIEPAAPAVPTATLIRDIVKRGAFVRTVRGSGTLVPEDSRWIPATTDGRVERILLYPGAGVETDSVVLELSNPQVEQEALNARLQLQSAQAQLEQLRFQYENELLTLESQIAALDAEFEQARIEAETKDALAKRQLVSEIDRRQAQLRADTLAKRVQIEHQRVASTRESLDARLGVPRAAVDQARALAALAEGRLQSLRVRAGLIGVVQQMAIEIGQRVAAGTNLARVANPVRLKAELRISETQARDVEIGQRAEIDTRSGIVTGRVSRKDPAAANGTVTVDVTPIDTLPRGAVPDLNVDGTIQLERLENVLFVGRPSRGQEESTIGLFRVTKNGDAQRVPVKLGQSSASTIVVLSGLAEGDEVILSDMSAWDEFHAVRLR